MDTELGLVKKMLFERWKIYATTKLSRQREIRKAAYFYNVRLKQKAVNSLRGNSEEAKRVRSLRENIAAVPSLCSELRAARNLGRKFVLKRAIRTWALYSRNRRRKRNLNMRTTELRDELVLGKYIKNWKFICAEKKRNLEIEKKAISFHRDSLLRKSMGFWIEDRNRRLSERKQWEDAIVHYRKQLLNRTWRALIKYHNVKTDKANKITEIRELYESKLLQRSFRALHSNVSLAFAKRQLHETATHFRRTVLLRKVLLAWIYFHRREVEIEKILAMHTERREHRLKRKTLQQWVLYVWEKKCNRRRANNATNYYKKKLASKTIAAMRNYVLYRRQKVASLFYLKIEIVRVHQAVQRIYVDKWRIAVIRLAQTRQKTRRAEEHWAARTTRHYFLVWKIFSESYKARAKHKMILSDIGRCVLLNKYLKLWRAKYRAVSMVNEKLARAVTMYSMKIKLRLFGSWKKYAKEKARRRMEAKEATKFHAHLLPRDRLTEASRNRLLERSENAKKISVDDFRIMRSYFDRWSEFLRRDERKKFTYVPRRNTNGRSSFIPYATRLVIPEYMKTKMLETRKKPEICANDDQRDHFDFREFATRFLNRSRSGDRSTSSSETSNDSSHATYSLSSPIYVRNGTRNSSNCFP